MKISDILLEKTIDVDEDVEIIYNTYVKDTADQIVSNQWNFNLPNFSFSTSELKSPIAQQAHAVNPCTFTINYSGGNFYSPRKHQINFSFNSAAINIITQAGNFSTACDWVGDQVNRFKREFNPEVNKGSIHHELAHWIQDSLHNKHITKMIDKAEELGKTTLSPDGRNINVHHMEIDSQIHAVVQLKKHHASDWNYLSFSEMIGLSPALSHLKDSLTPEEYKLWSRRIKHRLAREGLLGKNMR